MCVEDYDMHVDSIKFEVSCPYIALSFGTTILTYSLWRIGEERKFCSTKLERGKLCVDYKLRKMLK